MAGGRVAWSPDVERELQSPAAHGWSGDLALVAVACGVHGGRCKYLMVSKVVKQVVLSVLIGFSLLFTNKHTQFSDAIVGRSAAHLTLDMLHFALQG